MDTSYSHLQNEYDEEAINQQLQDQRHSSSAGSAKFAEITNYLALKPGQKWTWEQLAALPNVQEWRNKTPQKNGYMPSDANYSINAGLTETGSMMAYGNKQQPKLVVLSSGQGVMEDEGLNGVYKLNDYFDQKDLTNIHSNCDVEGMFDQKFYKWQKKGAKPLYVYQAIMSGNAGTTEEYGIAESLNEFFKPQYEDTYLERQSIDQNNNDVVCSFGNQLAFQRSIKN